MTYDQLLTKIWQSSTCRNAPGCSKASLRVRPRVTNQQLVGPESLGELEQGPVVDKAAAGSRVAQSG